MERVRKVSQELHSKKAKKDKAEEERAKIALAESAAIAAAGHDAMADIPLATVSDGECSFLVMTRSGHLAIDASTDIILFNRNSRNWAF